MAGFKAFIDPSTTDYDKIVVSRNPLANLKPFTLDPSPTQMYPDGHPMNNPSLAAQPANTPGASGTTEPSRAPASVSGSKQEAPPTVDLESGAIKSFFSN